MTAYNDNKTSKSTKTLYSLLICIFLFALIFTAITAFLPYPPYILSSKDDIETINWGFPIKYIEQHLDDDSINALDEKGINNSFILPRYDKYTTNFHTGMFFCCLGCNFLIFTILYLLLFKSKKIAKKTCAYFGSGIIVTILGMILPVAPGTFTVNDLNPMKFGFILKFVEQTPNVNMTWGDLDLYLAQTYIAPHYNDYTTYINVYKGILCIIINTAIIAIIVFIFKFIISSLKIGIYKTYLLFFKPIYNYFNILHKSLKKVLTKTKK